MVSAVDLLALAKIVHPDDEVQHADLTLTSMLKDIIEVNERLALTLSTIEVKVKKVEQAFNDEKPDANENHGTAVSALEAKLDAMNEKIELLLKDSVPEPISVPTPISSSETYPTPNEATSDGGIWMKIGSSRYWAKDLSSLKTLTAKILNKIK